MLNVWPHTNEKPTQSWLKISRMQNICGATLMVVVKIFLQTLVVFEIEWRIKWFGQILLFCAYLYIYYYIYLWTKYELGTYQKHPIQSRK